MSGTSCRVLMPQYMRHFQCTGGRCEDTCCAGWEVPVDRVTLEKYRGVSDPELALLLKENVGPGSAGQAWINMGESRRCPFLTSEGLCFLQLKLGEDFLSDTCYTFPRVINEVEGVLEKSATVSCPEAARLVLLDPAPMGFAASEEAAVGQAGRRGQIKKRVEGGFSFYPGREGVYGQARKVAINLLQERRYPLEERLVLLGMFVNWLAGLIAAGDREEMGRQLQEAEEDFQAGVISAKLREERSKSFFAAGGLSGSFSEGISGGLSGSMSGSFSGRLSGSISVSFSGSSSGSFLNAPSGSFSRSPAEGFLSGFSGGFSRNPSGGFLSGLSDSGGFARPAPVTVQARVLSELSGWRSRSEITSQRYRGCLRWFWNGLQYGPKARPEEIAERYREFSRRYYQPFLMAHSYILEHYLVNYAFANLFPFDERTVLDAYIMLMLRYAVMKMQLVGIAAFHGRLTPDLAVRFIQAFERTMECYPGYLRRMMDMICVNGWDNLAGMAALIGTQEDSLVEVA